jgi:hypothetical protein
MNTAENLKNILHTEADKVAEIDRLTTLADEFTAKGHTKAAQLARTRRLLVQMTTPADQAPTRARIIDLMH